MNKIRKKIVEADLFKSINRKLYRGINRVISGIYNRIQKLLGKIDRKLATGARKRILESEKICDNEIMLITYQGDYTCNPKAIAEEILKRKLPYKITWVVKKNHNPADYPSEFNLVRRESYEFYQAAGRAKLFVDNTHDLPRLDVDKKEGQYLIQTWHGALGLKRLDGKIVMNKTWKNLAEKCRRDTDYIVSNSTFENMVYETSYWKGVPCLLYGHCRNDILFTEDTEKLNEIRKKVYRFLRLDDDVKIFLYGPTHKDGVEEKMSQIDTETIVDALEKRFGGNWIVAVRLHSRLKNRREKWIKGEKVIDATMYPDIQELMIAAEAGATDYSSWIFDYLLLKRPGFILAEDFERFRATRDTYYSLDEVPFPIGMDNKELCRNIEQFDEKTYAERVENFLKARGCVEDGHAAERVVDKIEELMKG